MLWGLQRVGNLKVCVLEEESAHFRGKEQNGAEYKQEYDDRYQVVNDKVWVERNAIDWIAFIIFVLLDANAVRVV